MLNLKGEAASVIPIWKKRKFKIYYLNGTKKPLLAYKDFLTVQEERKRQKNNESVEINPSNGDNK
jgi:hypothetical protein